MPKLTSNTLTRNWAITARYLGAGIGLAEMMAGFVGLPVSSAVLAFAGGLLVAPNIALGQEIRNRARDDKEEKD